MFKSKKEGISFMALCMGFFMIILDVTIVNVALPVIASYFSTTLSKLQWVVDGYTIAFVGLLLVVGWLSDYFGAKKIFLLGLILFSITSLSCALASSIFLLIFFRFLQGASAAFLLPSSLSLINNIYQDPKEKAQAIGIWASLGGVACASGPFLGGVLTAVISWRAIFLINILIGCTSYLVVSRTIVSAKLKCKAGKIDFLGQIVGFIALLFLVFALIEVCNYGLNGLIMTCLALSISMLLLFIFIEHKVKNPMIPLWIFRNKMTSMGLAVSAILNLCFYGALFTMPFYFANIRHYSTLRVGLALLPLPGLAVIGSYLGGKVISKWGAALVIFIGFFIAACGFLALIELEQNAPIYLWIMLPFLAIGFGVSFATPAMTFAVLHSVQSEYEGILSAVLNIFNQVGNLIGVAIFGSIVIAAHSFVSGMHIMFTIIGITFLITAFSSVMIMGKFKSSAVLNNLNLD